MSSQAPPTKAVIAQSQPNMVGLGVFRIGDDGCTLGGVSSQAGVKTGFIQLDNTLVGQGWPKADLTEILYDGCGMGELSLLLPAVAQLQALYGRHQLHGHHAPAAETMPTAGHCVWIAPPYIPYAPALEDVGIDLSRLFIIDTGNKDIRTKDVRVEDVLWVAEQSLASGAVECVCIWTASAITDTSLRRLKHAAVTGGVICWLMRPTVFAQHASPASLRIKLTASEGGGLTLNILKRRGLPPNKLVELPHRDLPCLNSTRRPAITRPVTSRLSSLPPYLPAHLPPTPILEWLGGKFGQTVINGYGTPVRPGSMAPDR
jgi:cell division inhibitor SulA/protein ImuA